MPNQPNITILVAPLDWGLGHATRCIPVIRYLLSLDCKIIIAAEDKQEILLKTEFPNVSFVYIPGYRIRYSSFKRFFSLNIVLQIPKILRAITHEKTWLDTFVKNNSVDAVISDNRYGLYHHSVPCVFISHQLQIKIPFGLAEKAVKNINDKFIEKFSLCWVPDEKGSINLAGSLSHPAVLPKLPVTYLGGLSRLNKRASAENKSNILIVLSGPEPQRTLFENIMLKELKNYTGKAKLVRGLPGSLKPISSFNEVEIIDHLPAAELEKAFFESEYIISRSGYTTIMDICKTGKKSILIPTPGQTEQEYLAKHLQKQGWCIAASQENFSLSDTLAKAKNFNYKPANLDMEHYKQVLDNWVRELQKNKDKDAQL